MAVKNEFRNTKARRQLRRGAKDMRRVRVRGYRALDKGIENLFGELASSQKGIIKQLTRGQARDMDLLLGMKARMRKGNSRTAHAFDAQLDAYGSGGGMLTAGQTAARKDVSADAQRSNAEAQAGVQYGRGIQKSTSGIMDILKQTTKSTGAAAEYAASEALQQRTTEDTALIAQQQHEIAMQEYAAQQAEEQAARDFARQKKLALYQQKLAEGTVANGGALSTAVNGLVNAAQAIREFQGSGMSKEEIEQRLLSNPDLSSAESMAIQRLVNSYFSNEKGRLDSVTGELMDVVRGIPGWEKAGQGKKDHLKGWVKASLQDYEGVSQEAAARIGGADVKSGTLGETTAAALKKRIAANADSYEPAEERDIVINWFRDSLEAKLAAADPDADPSVIKQVTDLFVDSDYENWTDVDTSQKAINIAKKVYYMMPSQYRGVFSSKFESDWF
jgi:hypothetical protein